MAMTRYAAVAVGIEVYHLTVVVLAALAFTIYLLLRDRNDAKAEIELLREADDRWIADVLTTPGALAYGKTPQEALQAALDIAESAKTL